MEGAIPGTSGYQRGHIVDARHRERIISSNTNDNIFKDYYSTFVMSDVFPEYDLSQSPINDPWIDVAQFLSDKLVGTYNQSSQQFTGKDKELYIIAGRDGAKTVAGVNVSVPDSLWRVVLVLNHGQKLSDITQDNMAFAVYLPNDASRGDAEWKDPQYLMSVADLEQKLLNGENINFFNNLPPQISSVIKNRSYQDIYNWIAGGVYPLLAEEVALPTNTFNSIGINAFPDANSTELLPNTLEPLVPVKSQLIQMEPSASPTP